MRIFWQRLDMPGHELASLSELDQGWRLQGTVLMAHEQRPCRIAYDIRCGADWTTSHVHVRGEIGHEPVHIEITRDEACEWHLDGMHIPAVSGCIDVDLGFSPSTNLLPIRRLQLNVGEQAEVCAAWVRFPELTVEPLEQRYLRIGEQRYVYESAGGAFRRDLLVDHAGFILDYPDFWRAISVMR